MSESICVVDVDESEYIGNGKDGCFVATTKGPDGWYTSVLINSETGSFVDALTTDDGPYASEEEARVAGVDAAIGWCGENDVNYLQRVRIEFKAGSDPARVNSLIESFQVPREWEVAPETSGEGSCVVVLTFQTERVGFDAIHRINETYSDVVVGTWALDPDEDPDDDE